MKRIYRFALMHFIGIAGATLTAVSVWSLYFTANKIFLLPMIFGGLMTWLYLEVVAPDKKPKVIKKVSIEDKDYISIFNKK